VTNCAEHGAGFETFICEHLAQNPRQRWYSAEVSDENPWPDAWCRSCNLVFELEGEWNESNARSMRASLLCHECYQSARSKGFS
jgi:hypothetical protein